MNNIRTLGELKKSGYKPKSVKEEIRQNLVQKLQKKENAFPGIIGYEDTVIPDTERALLSRHNILFLGLRGQAKTRMARQMITLLDEFIPIVEGSEVNDSPFDPLSRYARDLVAEMGDKTPIAWIPREARYGEKLATPDVSVADLVGDIDPIKAANLKLNYADERVIHFGIIPRSNRGIFVINELPDLQARIQVSLFNILQEGDIQIRGFKVRMPLDIMFVFTANPEDYTNRGSIVTPLKDRIESQIITHYPKNLENSLLITEQEANVHEEQRHVQISDMIKRLIEQVAFEARNSEYVDKKSGVSARLTIAAYENAVSAGERRAIINKEKDTHVRIADLQGIIPAITGKIELVYEGEQEGPLQVAVNLLDKAIRSVFAQYFPNPDSFKKRKQNPNTENPYRSVIQWFDKGNAVQLLQDVSDKQYETSLKKVEGLKELVKAKFPGAANKEQLLLMEFVLHGLASYSLISKKVVENETRFSDLLGTMMNFGTSTEEENEEF
jgi:magnesium chelatase subunit I